MRAVGQQFGCRGPLRNHPRGLALANPIAQHPATTRGRETMRDTSERQSPRRLWNWLIVLTAIASLAAATAPAGADQGDPKLRATKEHSQGGSNDFRIRTVSARNDLVSGGDVLMRIDVADSIPLAALTVKRNDSDVTGSFHALPGA